MIKAVEIRGAVIDADHCRPLADEEAIDAVVHGHDTVWVDIRWSDRDAAAKVLTEQLHYHRLAVEDALDSHERPALQEFDGILFLSVFVPFRDRQDGDPAEPAELAFFLRERSLVTVSEYKLDVIDDWFARWEDHPHRVGDHPAFLMHALLDSAVDTYFPLIDKIEDEIDDVTEAIFHGDSTQLPKIMQLKRELLGLRRAIGPTRDVLNSLLRRDVNQVPPESKIYFQDVYDHALRLGELIDSNRDTITSVLDVHLSTTSNNLNAVVKKMTVVSTVLMTMGLIAGIYGMNFDRMPELHWRLGYPFALGLMLVVALITLGVFKLVKWL